MSYDAKVLADSIGPSGQRLLTVEVTFPRFILAEVNTHRMFSRNSASSRAIPPEKQIERLVKDPFIPEAFHTRVKGMGQGDPITDQDRARDFWLKGADKAIEAAEGLMSLGISKAHVNRLLEPYMWHTAIITATDWDNFFALRCPPGDEVDYDFPAQPEFQRAALCMRQVMRASDPTAKTCSQWHLPLVNPIEVTTYDGEDSDTDTFWPMVSAGRCARVSFDTQGTYEDPAKSYTRALGLLQNGHLSPLEHPAWPASVRMGQSLPYYQNLHGWESLRHMTPLQANLVGHKDNRGSWDA